MHLFVGSSNPVKINAVVAAASETWPDVVVTGYDVASGIPDQPIGDKETKLGALNRAQAALAAGLQEHPELTHDILGVGLEGGVVDIDGQMHSTVWGVVVDTTGFSTAANGARFALHHLIADRIKRGQEMGPVMEQLIGVHDVRQKQGMIGVVTNGFVDRTEEYATIAKLALGLWHGRDWAKKL